MKNIPEFTYGRIRDQLRRHFDFLFKDGFSILSINFVGQFMEQWEITLFSRDCCIKIYHDANELMLSISKSQLFGREGFIDLRELVSLVAEGLESFPYPGKYSLDDEQQFEQLAYFLQKYMDDIFTALGDELPQLLAV